MSKELKLFVWTDFCPDYTSGLAFAIAENESKARQLVAKEKGYEPYEWGTLHTHKLTTRKAYCVSGGG